jgi:hypothetical protein
MDRHDVEERLNKALQRLRDEDALLLENDLSERCIAARLALHLQPEFPGYKVDGEYNRAGEIKKRVPLSEECDTRKNREGSPLAVPDVIVHRRGDNVANVLVLELKKTSNPTGWNCDRERVRAFREHLHYEFAALIECETRYGAVPGIVIADWFDDEMPQGAGNGARLVRDP